MSLLCDWGKLIWKSFALSRYDFIKIFARINVDDIYPAT